MLFNSFKRTYLTISLTFTIAKRFGHGDRPMGHASKILQALAKKTPPLSPSSVANTPQDASSNRPHNIPDKICSTLKKGTCHLESSYGAALLRIILGLLPVLIQN